MDGVLVSQGSRPASVGHELPELAAPRGMAQLAQRVRLDLADALAGEAELLADLLERPRPAVLEAEPQPEHPLLAALEAVEDLRDLLLEELIGDDLVWPDRVRILDQLTELRVAFLADRRLERDGSPTVATNLLDPLGGDRHARILGQLRGDLLRRGFAAQLERELTRGPRDPLHGLDHVDRDADRPRLVGEAALDRLADPPRRVRRELEPALPLELVDGPHQARV